MNLVNLQKRILNRKVDMFVTVQNKHQIVIHDSKTGNVTSTNYIPEEVVSAYPQGDDEITVQTVSSVVILRRASRNSPVFTVYMRRTS